jgi:hypothetical protein
MKLLKKNLEQKLIFKDVFYKTYICFFPKKFNFLGTPKAPKSHKVIPLLLISYVLHLSLHQGKIKNASSFGEEREIKPLKTNSRSMNCNAYDSHIYHEKCYILHPCPIGLMW